MMTTSEKLLIISERCKELINKNETWISNEDKKILQYANESISILEQIIKKENEENEKKLTDFFKIKSVAN